ncbi:MAG: LysR family transcriptional regulator [Proteobacteria bacterium]|nr:LysR family transcriptional regulator [Pseudomonadota bacterium]
MDRLASMQLFVRVVEAESFSAAATQVSMSKSAVSKHVQRLEDHLDVRLLNRTTRRLSLTETGRDYYQRCKRILAEVEEAELSVSHLHSQPKGLLRVNAPMSFGVLHVTPLIPDFMARYPALGVDLALNDRYVDLVEEGYDVAVRIGQLADSSLIARRLAPARAAVCASPAYLARHGRPARPEDLKAHNCLGYAYFSSGDEWRFRVGGRMLTVRIAGNFRANNGEVLREAAVRGLGLALLPTFICGRDLKSGALEAVLREAMPEPRGIFAVYPQGRYLSAKIRAFVDFLAAAFGPRPYWEPGSEA